MKIMLLGGSNSTIKFGLKSGLLDDISSNHSLGASSSIQNLFAIKANVNALKETDVIVSESNVNDIHNLFYTRYTKETIVSNIHFLYEELWLTGKRVVIILLPLYRLKPNFPSKEEIDSINSVHRSLAEKFGFEMVDLTKSFDQCDIKGTDIKFLMSDYIHPINSFMYCLGVNIKEYLSRTRKLSKDRELGKSNFISLFPNADYKKQNSLFKRSLKKITLSPVVIELPEDSRVFGIETWSNGDSQLKIESLSISGNKKKVIKSFNKNLAFNELEEKLIGDCSFSANEFYELPTEPSTDVYFENHDKLKYGVLLSGLLLQKEPRDYLELDDSKFFKDLGFLIPAIEPWIESGKRLIEKHGFTRLSSRNTEAVREAIVELNTVKPDVAAELRRLLVSL